MRRPTCQYPGRVASLRFRSSVAYAGHVPLNTFERGFLSLGSALASINNPYRADMIATLSETTAGSALHRMRDYMLQCSEGRRILRDRPRLSSRTIDLPSLRQLPPNTFGCAYVEWLDRCKVTPDTRAPVRFIDDPELAYVMQRYRECHDFYHVISGPFPVSVGAEIVVKWFEMANLGLPVAVLSAVFGPLRLSSSARRHLLRTYAPWALQCGVAARPMITVYWEDEWSTPIKDLKGRLNISEPPIEWSAYRQSAKAA